VQEARVVNPDVAAMTETRVRRTREEQREETRRRLLESAGRLFARRGYEATSVEEIAEAAGYSRGAVYSNFRDKDEMYVTVLEDRMCTKLAEMRATVSGIEDLAARFLALREHFVNEREDDTPILYAELQLAAARHPELRRKLRAMFDRHFESCIGVVLGPGFAVDAFRPAFVTMFAVLEGLALQRTSGNASLDEARDAKRIVFDAVTAIVEAQLRS
jgi:AcrR family transcriptional regulator